MFGVSTLKALCVAWSSSWIEKSTPRGKSDTPPPSWRMLPRRPGRHRATAGVPGWAWRPWRALECLDRPVAQVVAEAGQPAREEDEHDDHADRGGEELPARRQVDHAALDDGRAEDGAEGRREPSDGGGGEDDEAGRRQERRLRYDWVATRKQHPGQAGDEARRVRTPSAWPTRCGRHSPRRRVGSPAAARRTRPTRLWRRPWTATRTSTSTPRLSSKVEACDVMETPKR